MKLPEFISGNNKHLHSISDLSTFNISDNLASLTIPKIELLQLKFKKSVIRKNFLHFRLTLPSKKLAGVTMTFANTHTNNDRFASKFSQVSNCLKAASSRRGSEGIKLKSGAVPPCGSCLRLVKNALISSSSRFCFYSSFRHLPWNTAENI
jgi:hypothetical protein